MSSTRTQRQLVNVARQIHKGLYLNCLHKTIFRLSHLFQISLFSTRAFSKLHSLSFFNITLKTYPGSVSI